MARVCSTERYLPGAGLFRSGSRPGFEGIKMKRLILFVAVALAFTAAGVRSQTKAKVPAPKKGAPSVSDLVLQGKIPEAVKLAAKSPLAAESALNSLFAAADTQIALRDLSKAQETLDAAQKFADACDKTGRIKDIPRDALKGRQLRLQGIQLSDQKDFAKAEAFLRQALQISKQAKDPSLEAGVHNNLGYALRNMNLLEEAAREFETARLLAEEQKDDLRAGSYNFNLGEVLNQLKRLDAAMEAFKRSAEQNKAASRPNIQAKAVFMQAVVADKLHSNTDESLKLFQEAESMFEKLGDDLNVGWCFFLMGEHVAYTMDFRKAADFAEKGLPFFVKSADKAALLRSYEFLTDMHGRLGNTQKAEAYKKQAADLSIKK